MLKYVSYFPELFIFSSIPLMWIVNQYRASKTAKTFYTISKVFLLLSFLFALDYKENSTYIIGMNHNSYVFLYKLLIITFGLLIFFLSCKWFLNKNKSSFSYYSLGMSGIFCLSVLVATSHLLVLSVAYFLLQILLYYMLRLSEDVYEYEDGARRYFIFAFIFSIVLLSGAFTAHQYTQSWEMVDLAKYLKHESDWVFRLIMLGCLILPLLYLMGIAPLHFGLIEYSGISILPVCMYRVILPVIGGYAVLMNMISHIFAQYHAILSTFVSIVSVVSLFLGAICAIKENNLRRMFVYCGLYCMGFILLASVPFNANSFSGSFMFFLTYLIAIYGVYTCMFAFKSNGEYLTEISDINGVFNQKPYVAVILTVFIVSLAGSPPLLGFLGKLQAVDNMIVNQAYVSISLAMIALLLIMNGYFRLVRTMFFEARMKTFDRADKGIYLSLFLNILICISGLLNPTLFMEKLASMLAPLMR